MKQKLYSIQNYVESMDNNSKPLVTNIYQDLEDLKINIKPVDEDKSQYEENKSEMDNSRLIEKQIDKYFSKKVINEYKPKIITDQKMLKSPRTHFSSFIKKYPSIKNNHNFVKNQNDQKTLQHQPMINVYKLNKGGRYFNKQRNTRKYSSNEGTPRNRRFNTLQDQSKSPRFEKSNQTGILQKPQKKIKQSLKRKSDYLFINAYSRNKFQKSKMVKSESTGPSNFQLAQPLDKQGFSSHTQIRRSDPNRDKITSNSFKVVSFVNAYPKRKNIEKSSNFQNFYGFAKREPFFSPKKSIKRIQRHQLVQQSDLTRIFKTKSFSKMKTQNTLS